jgi:NAD(P)-dependent dehydrogenase (short-subunit alcohol dehydrogenase family)
VNDLKGSWALILGASSGFGEATSLELARRGMNICGVHLDRKQMAPNIERIVSEIRTSGAEALFFNVNAADQEKRREVLDALGGKTGSVRVLMHSLAFGSLRPFLSDSPEDGIHKSQMEMTLDVMAHSLVYWVQDLWRRKLLVKGSRIFAMTSAGSTRIWPGYGAVSAAKAALESHIRQLAFELAPHGIAANAVRAGVTDTPALHKIPGSEKLLEGTLARHPGKRLTSTRDVACTIAALAASGLDWVTGNTIGVDGAEILI